jgi:hypothetical protein
MRGNTIAVVVGYRLNAVILPGRKIQGGEPILLVATSVEETIWWSPFFAYGSISWLALAAVTESSSLYW